MIVVPTYECCLRTVEAVWLGTITFRCVGTARVEAAWAARRSLLLLPSPHSRIPRTRGGGGHAAQSGRKPRPAGRAWRHDAARAGCGPHVTVVARSPLHVCLQDNGMTPLMLAAVEGHWSSIAVLVESSMLQSLTDVRVAVLQRRRHCVAHDSPAPPRAQQHGWTALHFAAFGNKARCITLLLKVGVDPRAETKVRVGACAQTQPRVSPAARAGWRGGAGPGRHDGERGSGARAAHVGARAGLLHLRCARVTHGHGERARARAGWEDAIAQYRYSEAAVPRAGARLRCTQCSMMRRWPVTTLFSSTAPAGMSMREPSLATMITVPCAPRLAQADARGQQRALSDLEHHAVSESDIPRHGEVVQLQHFHAAAQAPLKLLQRPKLAAKLDQRQVREGACGIELDTAAAAAASVAVAVGGSAPHACRA